MNTSQRACKKVTKCKSDEFRSKGQTKTSDVVCSKIPKNHHIEFSNSYNSTGTVQGKTESFETNADELHNVHYLDRFHINCRASAVNGFKPVRQGNTHRYKYRFNCTSLPIELPYTKTKFTIAKYDGGGNNNHYLDKHRVIVVMKPPKISDWNVPLTIQFDINTIARII